MALNLFWFIEFFICSKVYKYFVRFDVQICLRFVALFNFLFYFFFGIDWYPLTHAHTYICACLCVNNYLIIIFMISTFFALISLDARIFANKFVGFCKITNDKWNSKSVNISESVQELKRFDTEFASIYNISWYIRYT